VKDEEPKLYEFDEFQLDVAKRQLLRAGEVVPIYSKTFDLLLLLVQSGGRDLAKDEILESIWPQQEIEESNLTVNISAVRKALGEKAAQPRFLITLPGRGYRFVADVREQIEGGLVIEGETISQITIEQEIEDDSAAPSERLLAAAPAKSIWRRPGTLVAVGLLILGLFGGAALWIRNSRLLASNTGRYRQLKLRQLTSDGRTVNAAISPDGKSFVFSHDEAGRVSLRLGSINGEAPVELRPPANVSYRGITFASDGGSIFYVASEETRSGLALYRLPLLGRLAVKLREDFVPFFAISPDNQQVAIVRADQASRTNRLLISNLDGSNERMLLELPYSRGLFGPNISWSPDGSMMAMGLSKDDSGTQGAIFLMPAAGGEPKALTVPNWREIERTIWLKDSTGLLMIGASHDTQEGRQVWLIDYPSGEFRRITTDLNSYDIGLSVSADANNILLVQHQQITNIWMAPAEDLAKFRQVTFGALNRGDGGEGVDWLATDKIIYTARVANSSTIWIMGADGSNPTELTPPGGNDSIPSATADGKFIVFESTRGGGSDIWRVESTGANPKQLTRCGKNVQPHASPDGKWVVYRSECDTTGTLWRVSIDGGDPVRITDHAVAWPWISPDSKWVACEYAQGVGNARLGIVPIEGGSDVKLFEIPPLTNFRYGIRWSADGRSVTYRDWGKGLWRQSIEGGAPQQLSGLPEEKIYSYSWSRDGKQLAFTRGVEIRDAVLISSAN
jgi:Tol biopolymer transport system component/DNA-binding winged helix-turn-helix (wHTH) protein